MGWVVGQPHHLSSWHPVTSQRICVLPYHSEMDHICLNWESGRGDHRRLEKSKANNRWRPSSMLQRDQSER